MGRIVAISSGDLESTKPLNAYALGMISGETRNVLFIGTASHDASGYVENINAAFSQLGCQVRALNLTTKAYSAEEMQELLSWADILYVGGGDTIFMMNTWKRCGLDAALKDVYRRDSAVLMGISAGAMCWFRRGCTDSPLAEIREGEAYGWANNLLGIHDLAYCPHYEDRVADCNRLMQDTSLDCLAMESNTAFVEENGAIHFLKTTEAAKAYKLSYQHGRCEKEEIVVRLIRKEG